MKKRTAKTLLILLVVFTSLVPLFTISASASAVDWHDCGQGWRIRIDSPDTAKPYYHMHFFHNSQEVGCLNLETLQTCDGFSNNGIPKWVMKDARNYAESKNRPWGSRIEQSTISWGRLLLLFGCVILVVVMMICPFDGPAGDAIAWGLLLGVA